MSIETLCPPALIYLIFSVTQIIIDVTKGMYNTALMKFFVAIMFTTLLNYLCMKDLGIVSWIIVFIPFILMTLIIAMLLIMFGMSPKSGKLNINTNKQPIPEKPDARRDSKQEQKDASDNITPQPAASSASSSSKTQKMSPSSSTPQPLHDLYYDSKTNKIVDNVLAM